MGAITITITPEGGQGAQTTVRVDADGSAARVTEIAVRSSNGAGVSETQLSTVDLDLLVRAVLPALGLSGGSADDEAREPRPRKSAARRSEPRPGEPRPSEPRRAARERTAGSTGRRTASARAYRKVPDDLADAFGRIGSVTGLAAHYGVPRHTAQGWVNRMRQQSA
jgi:hypothetical protein